MATSLPDLAYLFLRPVRQMPRIGCGKGQMRFVNKVAIQFRDAIAELDLTEGAPSFAISIRGAIGGAMLRFDAEKKRFIVSDP